MSLSAHMDVQEIAPSTCAEGWGTSTSSTQMHTRQLLMTLDVEALHRTPTTKGGLKTWAIATYQHHQRLHLLCRLRQQQPPLPLRKKQQLLEHQRVQSIAMEMYLVGIPVVGSLQQSLLMGRVWMG